MGKRTDQHLQDQANYQPESSTRAKEKLDARIRQEQRLAPPPSTPQTDEDDRAHDRARAKLKELGFLSGSL